MTKKQLERLTIANEILKEMNKVEQRYFKNESFIPFGKSGLHFMTKNGIRVPVRANQGYGYGPWMNRLLDALQKFIKTGRKATVVDMTSWCYLIKEVDTLNEFAKEKGFLLKEGESDEFIVQACKKLGVEPNEIFGLDPSDDYYVIFNNDPKYGSGLYLIRDAFKVCQDRYIKNSESWVIPSKITLERLLDQHKKNKVRILYLPQWDCEHMQRQLIFDYLIDHFHFEDLLSRILLNNILDFVQINFVEPNATIDFLLFLLDGTGITRTELNHLATKRINYIEPNVAEH